MKQIRTFFLSGLILFLSACVPEMQESREPPILNASGDIEAVAKAILVRIQPTSISQNTEFCGSIVQRVDGSVYATWPEAGDDSSCGISYHDEVSTYQAGDILVGDYHTHSAYDYYADSEVPSTSDLEGNGAEGVPGYVATPGGRFWYVSADGSFAYQIRSVGCLPMDPNFVDETGEWTVPRRISYDELVARQGG